MAAAKFPLEHFYFGQLVIDDKPASRARLLATSPGITQEIAAAAVERVTLPALPGVGTWALVRGTKQLPFILVQSQIGDANQTVAHYILMPADALRAMGGNLRALSALNIAKAPVYAETGAALSPVEISQPEPETAERQVEDILELMNISNNSMDIMESLLAAIVGGVQIIVKSAPPELNRRIDFVSGLLALLPPSVRFAVTFTTHSQPNSDLDAQIRFYTDDAPPADTLVYNWSTGELSGKQLEDDYSHFVISQLRLDTSLVIERTRELTSTAGWRMRQGDRLREALAYGSYRSKLDAALVNNQPANKDEVAKVLNEDPTLSEDSRVMYGKHLLAFSLAMDDIAYADPLIQLLASTPELERTAYQQIADALDEKRSPNIYKLIEHWLAGANLENNADRWINLAHHALMMHLDSLVAAKNLDALNALCRELLLASPAIHLERITGKITEKLLPLTPNDATLAENVFLLAAQHMETSLFKRLMETRGFLAQLRPQVGQVMAYLSGAEVRTPPAGLMYNTARLFGEQWEATILVRFAELARQIGRFDLLDEPTLRSVAQLATTPQAPSHYQRLAVISDRPTESDLALLGAKAAHYLLNIRLALADYAGLAAQMLQQSATFYKGDLQLDYIKMVEQVFGETPIPSDEAPTTLEELGKNGIRSAPFIMAAIGLLNNRVSTPELDAIAAHVEHTLAGEPQTLNVIPVGSILALLSYHVKNNDTQNAIDAAALISRAAAVHSEDGLKVTGQMYRLMADNRATRAAAQQILQSYVREADDRTAKQAMAYYGRELGAGVRNTLEAVYLIKQLMGERELTEYAQNLQRTVAFLSDAAASYNERNQPTLDDLSLRLDAMTDTLLREERRVFTRALLAFARGIVTLYQQHRTGRIPDSDRLLTGTVDPVSAIDLLRVMGGYFSEGKPVELKLKASFPNPLGTRSRKILRDEALIGNEIISGLLRAVPLDGKLDVKSEHIRDALANMKRDTDDQIWSEAAHIFSTDLQRLAALIELIVEKGDIKAVEDGGLGTRIDDGKHRPRNVLEYLRYVHGYHLTRG